jgi:hypothetical protein
MKQNQLPVLNNVNQLNNLIDTFTDELIHLGFDGDIDNDYASRISSSMDNSVCMVVPELLVFPKGKSNVNKLFQLASQEKYRELKFTPLGGTGTAEH